MTGAGVIVGAVAALGSGVGLAANLVTTTVFVLGAPVVVELALGAVVSTVVRVEVGVIFVAVDFVSLSLAALAAEDKFGLELWLLTRKPTNVIENATATNKTSINK